MVAFRTADFPLFLTKDFSPISPVSPLYPFQSARGLSPDAAAEWSERDLHGKPEIKREIVDSLPVRIRRCHSRHFRFEVLPDIAHLRRERQKAEQRHVNANSHFIAGRAIAGQSIRRRTESSFQLVECDSALDEGMQQRARRARQLQPRA